MASKLMKISQYREENFVKGSAPTLRSIRSWIDDGLLKGKILGKQYFVEIEAQEPVNDLVNKVLAS